MLKSKIVSSLDASGITVGGYGKHDIHICDERTYKAILRGTLGMGEAYMNGWWYANDIDAFVSHAVKSMFGRSLSATNLVKFALLSQIRNAQRVARAFAVAEEHYDLHPEIYSAMLDERMTYTCGYYGRGAKTLDQAQFDKLDLVCEKLGLKPGDRVLDIGCGFGSFAEFAAKNYDVNVTGATVSEGQLVVAKQRTQGLPVQYLLQDYRKLDGEQFDHIVSIGMFEAVGYKNYVEFMKVADRMLKPGGTFLLHTIGMATSETCGDPWFDKYIFPNGMMPSLAQITKAIEGRFIVEDWHSFGEDYDTTLMEWWKNFNRAWRSESFTQEYDERFYRMWKLYLRGSAGLFRARHLQLWQFVFTRGDAPSKRVTIR
ncbi:cyclopropane fatty acyl phospholipid synthase [Candidatus Kaiserbacteria bacterium]|nr:MAG: cyclopropane fatty acyl phospholipid synthase [Candidatus Kaiserbacteria bacterium]